MSLIESITVENLDHLGIVAGLIDEIRIVELINQKLGVDNREKIATGQVIKALILNGLGMVSRPLYLFSQSYMFAPLEFLRKLIDAINRSVVAQLFSAAKRNPWFAKNTHATDFFVFYRINWTLRFFTPKMPPNPVLAREIPERTKNS